MNTIGLIAARDTGSKGLVGTNRVIDRLSDRT